MAALRGWQARGWRGLGWRVLGWRVRGWRGLGWRARGWPALMGWLLVAQWGLTCGALAQPSVMPILRIENGMHTDQVRRVLATADGEIFATISADKTARLWGGDGMLIRTLRPPIDAGPEGMLRAAALSQERRLLVAAGSTGAAWGREALIYIFPLDRDRMQRLPTGVPAEVTALAFAPGGDRLAIGFDGQAGIAIFNFATSEIMTAPQLGIRNGVTGLAFDAGGNLAIGAGDGNIHLLDLRLQPIRPPRQLPEGGRPADLAFSPDGRLLAVGHANMPVVRLLDARTLELRGAPPLGQALGRQRQSLGAVAWTAGPGGQAVLHAAGYVLDAQGRSALLRWTNLQTSPAAILPLGRDTIFHLQGLAGGRIAYAGAEPAWGVIAADGRAGLRLEGQGGDFRSIGAGLFRLRPDDTKFGRFPALGPGSFRISADAMIVEFGMDAGGQRPLRFDVRRRALEPSQASAPQAARPPLALPLRDWMNGASPYFGTQRLRLSPGEHARSAAPLPDGGFLLGTDTHLRRYDARGGEVSQEAVMAAVWGVQASADGTQAVVALGDGTIRWHGLDAAGSMPERAAFFAHRDGRRWLLWTPEGFFDHSDQGGQDLAGYHLNRRVQDMAEWVNFAQLYRVFHAEDLVRARLAREDEAPLRQRLAEIGDVRRLLRQAPAPSVTISALCFTTAPDGAERCQDFSAGGAQTRGLSRLREASLPVAQAAAAAAAAA